MNKEAAILVEDLHIKLGGWDIISGLNLHISKGNFYGIIGPNGAGKTTLLRTISGELAPERGQIYLEGTALTRLKGRARAKKMAYVAQNNPGDIEFKVLDYVLLGRYPYLRILQDEGTEDLAYARRAMELTNTWSLRDRSINTISGGERQRVILARAITQDTPIILLDEPISQLDIHHQVEVMDTLRLMVEKRGTTVVTVLHDLNMAAQYCDYLVLLNQGKIIKEGKPERVITNEIISSVYKLKVAVCYDLDTGRPYIIPRRGNNHQTPTL